MNLMTSKYHLVSYKNDYKVFLYDYRLIRRVNAALKVFAKGSYFYAGDEAIITFKSSQLTPVKKALHIHD